MAEFADLISKLPLYQELDHTAGRDGIGDTEVAPLKGLVNRVADTVGPAMAQIPVTFRQYTVHDIRHCRNVIARIGDILPPETREKLNALEITLLLLAALLHDAGMIVADHEKEQTLLSEDFRRFRAEGHADRNKAISEACAAGNEPRARAIEDALLAEYYRRLHPERVRQFMDAHLAGQFLYREVDFAEDLARLCESHAWGVEESNDARHLEKSVARLDDNVRLYGVRVNLQYLACILRLADILDFDRSRTPLAVFQHLDFSETKSWDEWNKHLQVKGYEITPSQVAFDIPCTHPVFYVAVQEFLGWIDEELRQCRYLVENKPQATADRYKLILPHVVDRHKVRLANPSYVAGAFRFQLEYENILALMMDKSLYPDPSLFLRELLQNALDACRRKEADMQVKGIAYKPGIAVWDRTDDPTDPRIAFQDNGIGMSQRIVEQYFLRVGRSYYRSPEFDAERQRLREQGKELDACSQFGIGILSCFLVGDRFEVETFQEGYDPLHIQIEGPSKYFVVQRLPTPEPSLLYRDPASAEEDGPPKRTGTRVTVHFRPGVKVDVWQTLDTFAVNVDFPIAVHGSGQRKPRVIQALRWEKPIRVKDCVFGIRPDQAVELPGLEEALVASIIPFSRHLRGRSWFWLLRSRHNEMTPAAGFLQVDSVLRLTGIAELVAELDDYFSLYSSYCEWSDRLRRRADDGNTPSTPIYLWRRLSDLDKERLDEVIAKRGRILEHGEDLVHWAEQPKVVKALLEGSIDWADQPVAFGSVNSSHEKALALHSILLPAGIVEWSPAEAEAIPLLSVPIFGGLRIDARGPQAPLPAAHRLFVPASEARDFIHQYLHASLLHGLDLVVKHGRTQDWRSWFRALVGNARGLNRATFVRDFGQHVEDLCGLAVRTADGEIRYASRAEALELIPGPIYLVWYDQSQGLIKQDPINQILCDVGEVPWYENVELDLSSLPIVEAKKRNRTKPTKQRR